MRAISSRSRIARLSLAFAVALSLVAAVAPGAGAWNSKTAIATATNVKIDGGGSVASVAAGASVRVQFDYTVNDTSCPGCYIQIGVGWNTEPGPQLCVYEDGAQGAGSADVDLVAPSTKGPHYLVWWPAADFGCNVSTTDWYGGDPNTIPGKSFLGRINVGTKTVTRDAGYVMKLSKVKLSGISTVDLKVAPGAFIDVRFAYSLKDATCPGCLHQMVVGWSHRSAPAKCIDLGQPGAIGVTGTTTQRLRAPTVKGSYFIAVDDRADLACQKAWWQSPTLDPDTSFIAHITVK